MNKCRCIRIGLDFHGVITAKPQFFKEFATEAMARGHEIHILTGGPYDKVKAELQHWQIPWTRLYAIFDYYKKQGEVTFFENGEFKVDEVLWDTAKAKYCVDNKIDFHIDDSSKYAKWFITPFCYFDVSQNSCFAANKIAIDFSHPPAEVICAIEAFTLSAKSES